MQVFSYLAERGCSTAEILLYAEGIAAAAVMLVLENQPGTDKQKRRNGVPAYANALHKGIIHRCRQAFLSRKEEEAANSNDA
jgi:hypothetical protein